MSLPSPSSPPGRAGATNLRPGLLTPCTEPTTLSSWIDQYVSSCTELKSKWIDHQWRGEGAGQEGIGVVGKRRFWGATEKRGSNCVVGDTLTLLFLGVLSSTFLCGQNAVQERGLVYFKSPF